MLLSRVPSPVLVGRDSELSTLEDSLLSAMRGDGGVVIAGGEAGMGKTRLVNALAARARTLGCMVLAGGCSEAELSLPYLPFLEAIGNYLTTADVRQLGQRLGPAASELAQLFPQLGSPSGSPTESVQAKLRLFQSILILLRDAAGHRALLLILEDLQWADPATRELLDYATRRLRSTNVRVVATYRTDEMHRKHALLPTIQGWRRNGQVELVELGALSATQIADMVCAICEERSISPEFRDFLHERSEGNPFVLEEMLRDAIDRGDIFRTEAGWDRKAVAEIRIPPNVRDTILQRLERLSREDVPVLSAASVFGRSFDLPSLAAVAQVDEAAALAALEASVNAQLIEEEDRVSGRYRFRHALTREAIYEDLVVPRRRQIHSRVADVLKSRRDRAPVELANHLFLAGRNDEAVAMCMAAAQDAIQARAYRDAAELLERAAPFVADPVQRAEMQCQAADSYWNNNDSPTAKRLLEHAIPELEEAGRAAVAAHYRVLLGRCWWELLGTARAREEFEKARAVLEPLGPSEALSVAYIRLSGLASFNEDPQQGLAFAIRAHEVAAGAGAAGAKAWSLNFMAISEMQLGRIGQGFAHLDESYPSAVAAQAGFPVGYAVYNAAWLCIHLARGRELAMWMDRLHSAFPTGTEPWLPYIRGLAALHRGQLVEALHHATASVQRSKDSGHQKMMWRSDVLRAFVLAECLRGEEAVAQMPPVSRRSDAQDMIYDAMPRVRCRLAVGDHAAADAEARAIPPLVCNIGSPADAAAEGSSDPSWLRSFMDSLPTQGEALALPRIAAARGRLTLAEDRFKDSRRELATAVTAFESGGFLLEAWHVGAALAAAEVRRGDPDAARRRLGQLALTAHAAPAGRAAHSARPAATR